MGVTLARKAMLGGDATDALPGVGRSRFLEQLNQRSDSPANRVHCLWSPDDAIIGFGGLVWGRYTAEIPGQHGELRLDEVGHFALRDDFHSQLELLRR